MDKQLSDWCDVGRHEICSKKFIRMDIEYVCLCTCHNGGNIENLSTPKNPGDVVREEVQV